MTDTTIKRSNVAILSGVGAALVGIFSAWWSVAHPLNALAALLEGRADEMSSVAVSTAIVIIMALVSLVVVGVGLYFGRSTGDCDADGEHEDAPRPVIAPTEVDSVERHPALV